VRAPEDPDAPQSWLGKALYHVEGVIHTYTPGEPGADDWTKVKHVPKARVLAHIDGSWRHRLRWRRAGPVPGEWTPLLDLSTLHAVPMAVRPLARQGPAESRRLWEGVTARLERKEFGEATRVKQTIEQRQRDDAAERKRKGVECVPRARPVQPVRTDARPAGSRPCSSTRTTRPASRASLAQGAPPLRASSRRRPSTRSSRPCPARTRTLPPRDAHSRPSRRTDGARGVERAK
jgi:hypothetical protein